MRPLEHLPHNQEVEQGLLGCLLIDPKKYDVICDFFHADMMYTPVHARIYKAIERIIESGGNPYPSIISKQFDTDFDLKERGGSDYIADLCGMLNGSTSNAKDYALNLQSLYIRRNLVIMADDLREKANTCEYSDAVNEDALEYAERTLTAIVDKRPIEQTSAGDAALKALGFMREVAEGRVVPVKTGIANLDESIRGLYKGGMYVIAARPGMGKTALGLTIADNIAQKSPVLFVSLEMEADELSQRLLAKRTGISVDKQREATTLNDWEWGELHKAQSSISSLPLSIVYKAGMTASAIKTAARRFKRKYGAFTLIVDYLGLIAPSDKRAQMVHQIAEITVAIKGLAKELEIPVVLLSQLNRSVETRENKRPCLADLRDSGAIEQDADVVMFIYRESYYLEREKPTKKDRESDAAFENRLIEWENDLQTARGKAEIIIEKNRQGRRSTAQVSFNGERQVFA